MSDSKVGQIATHGGNRDWTRLAARLAFAAFLLSLLTGLVLPVYTDEIGWRMQLRAGIDGGLDRMLNDMCGPNTIAPPPWFMMPLRYVTGWLNVTFASPLYVRAMGVLCALGWAWLLRQLIIRLSANEQQRHVLTALFFALLGMGILPIMLTMSRPEQAILLAFTGALLLASKAVPRDAETPIGLAWVWPLAIAALGIFALSSHLKGILIAPLIFLCIALAGRGKHTRIPRIAAALLFGVLTLQAAHYWVDRFRCPDDPVMAARLARENTVTALAGRTDWGRVAQEALHRADPNHYIARAEARPVPTSFWLPSDRITEQQMVLRYVPMNFAWNAAMLLGLACLVMALRRSWRERRIDIGAAAPPVMAGLVLVWGMSQQTKNDYEIIVMLPLIALACLLSITAIRWTPRSTRQLGFAAMLIVAISLIGQIDIARRFLPPLAQAAAKPGYVAGQDTSLSAFGYSTIKRDVLATARLCGIGARRRARHVLVDDASYFALADSWQPMHSLSVLGQWHGSIKDPLAYLASRGSDGMVVGCRSLSAELLARAKRNGDFCCIATGGQR
jgi:hypothetical protein